MRVLIACEFSGTVRERFQALGHEAWSCDLLPSLDNSPFHFTGDVRDILDGFIPIRFAAECDPDGDDWCQWGNWDAATCQCLGPTQDGVEYVERHGVLMGRRIEAPAWDLLIGHPPCTYLASSGLHWNTRVPGRAEKTEEALAFVRLLADAPIERIAIENPIGALSTRWRKPDQIVQPWMFGDDASKATCLWLKGLPALQPTDLLPGGKTARRANQTASGQNKLGPSPDRWKIRSVTYPGIADAMATQWGNV